MRIRFPARPTAQHALLAVLVATVSVSCHGDHPVAPPSDAGAIDVDDGDFERVIEDDADADSVLAILKPRMVTVTLHTSAGALAPHVRVKWFPHDGGTAEPAESFSDSLGHAFTKWTLGSDSGQAHTIIARAQGFTPLSIDAQGRVGLSVLNQITTLQFATYDGSGQTVHPDYVRVRGWKPHRRFLMITPYKSGDYKFENPSVFSATDFSHWRVPDGVTNPIVRPTELHLSDPDAVFDPLRAELMLYYRQVGDANSVWLTHSADGIAWSDPERLVTVPNHELVSPTVVRRSEHEWLMWAVNAHGGCSADAADVELRRSEDGVNWSAPEPVALGQGGGISPWHLEVQWLPSRQEYWAVYPVKSVGNCTTRALYLATSPDGLNWHTYPTPLLSRGASPDLADLVYRSTFAYDSSRDIVTFWYSGARFDGEHYVWKTAAERRTRADVFARISTTFAGLRVRQRDTPDLRDPP
ncbi:MAG TPA: hypothetical protein VE967_00650 [Gemmatimonadaceae bacterium]|nr:hypothetical protein [Gemmatimonadaceae bacterium]